jgi:hypothetical protein
MPADRLRVELKITDGDGTVFTGVAELSAAHDSKHKTGWGQKPRSPKPKTRAGAGEQIDLSLPLRNFVKEYSKAMGGPQRFTLLLAKLSNGKNGTPINLKEMAKTWGKMKALLGTYNGAYATRAKDYGWVDSPKMGSYVLTQTWKGIFEQ